MSDEFKVWKYSYPVTVSCCMLGSCEPGDHPAPPKPLWHKRVRWRINAWWFDNRPHVHRGPCPEDDA